jgi:hypothetical protein
METTLEDDDIRTPGSLSSKLERTLYGFGAGVAEEESIQLWGQNSAQFVDQVEHGLVYDDISLAVQELACLVADSFYDPWMAVTGAGDANARSEVQVSSSILIIEITTLAT